MKAIGDDVEADMEKSSWIKRKYFFILRDIYIYVSTSINLVEIGIVNANVTNLSWLFAKK